MNTNPKGTFALELGGAATVLTKVIKQMVGENDNTPSVSDNLILKLLVTKVVTAVGGDQ